MRLAAGLRLDPLGSYSAPQDPLVVIRGRGMGWKGLGIRREGQRVREESREKERKRV